jgi:exocyst complex component 5
LDLATSQETNKTEPDISYLPSLQPAITITNIMSRFINTVLIRLAESNTTVRRGMEMQTKSAVERIETKTNMIIRSTITMVLNWVTRLLSNQKKADFRPKDSELEGTRGVPGYLETLQTTTCASICTFLAKVATAAAQAIDGQNLEVFSCELATGVRDLLFEHFKKFQVNATGGLMVAKDMSRYVSTLKEWPLTKEAEGSIELLSEIGNFFIIGSEALRERSRNFQAGGVGKKLQKSDFRAFIMRRDDSGSVGIQSVLAGL